MLSHQQCRFTTVYIDLVNVKAQQFLFEIYPLNWKGLKCIKPNTDISLMGKQVQIREYSRTKIEWRKMLPLPPLFSLRLFPYMCGNEETILETEKMQPGATSPARWWTTFCRQIVSIASSISHLLVSTRTNIGRIIWGEGENRIYERRAGLKMITPIKIRKKDKWFTRIRKAGEDGKMGMWYITEQMKTGCSDEAAHQGVMTDFQARL